MSESSIPQAEPPAGDATVPRADPPSGVVSGRRADPPSSDATVRRADQPVGGAIAIEGLLVDWGGVMTGNLFASFASFCEERGLRPQALAEAFRGDQATREILFAFEEGRVAAAAFEGHLAQLLRLDSAEGLVQSVFAGARLEAQMVTAVRSAREAGLKTGLISNSWGTDSYPRDLLAELFDGIVISGEVGIRKPAPRIYELGAEAIGVPPERCVFVDDLPFNLPPAEELGMAVIHHTDVAETIAQLERLLGVPSLA